jgi:hypothetical protein
MQYSDVPAALHLQQDYYTWVLNEKRDITFKNEILDEEFVTG